MQIRFSFQVRMAMQVAICIAKEVEHLLGIQNYTAHIQLGNDVPMPAERGQETCQPVLLSVGGRTTFRFEGGTVVRVELVDVGGEYPNGRHCEQWEVVRAEARYYPRNLALEKAGKKISRRFNGADLQRLQQVPGWGWYHPHVAV